MNRNTGRYSSALEELLRVRGQVMTDEEFEEEIDRLDEIEEDRRARYAMANQEAWYAANPGQEPSYFDLCGFHQMAQLRAVEEIMHEEIGEEIERITLADGYVDPDDDE